MTSQLDDAIVTTVWEGIRRTHGAPPEQSLPIMPPLLWAMLDATPTRLDNAKPSLAGLRDHTLLLVGFIGALRRSELFRGSLGGGGAGAFRLDTGPLVTLVGPGGVGKTRLALHAAAELTGRFDDGVWLVELLSRAGRLRMDLHAPSGLFENYGRRQAERLLAAAGRPLAVPLPGRAVELWTSLRQAAQLLEQCAGSNLNEKDG